LTEFQALLERYPDSGKIPDAMLKIGYCNYELKAWDASRTALSMVVKNNPETTAARLASQRLGLLKSEGH
jgi:TolA-binding protein